MRSYIDEIRGTKVPPGWNSRALTERLLAASRRHGDTTDTSGRPDYVVRFVVNQQAPPLEMSPALIIEANNDGIAVIEQPTNGSSTTVASFSYDDPWLDGVERCFETFRTRLSQT